MHGDFTYQNGDYFISQTIALNQRFPFSED